VLQFDVNFASSLAGASSFFLQLASARVAKKTTDKKEAGEKFFMLKKKRLLEVNFIVSL